MKTLLKKFFFFFLRNYFSLLRVINIVTKKSILLVISQGFKKFKYNRGVFVRDPSFMECLCNLSIENIGYVSLEKD